MKKLFSFILTAIMAVAPCMAFAADSNVTVTVDGKALDFDVQPIIEESRVLVPLRAIFEALDCIVDYDEYDGVKTVTARKGEEVITFEIGDDEMFVNAERYSLDVPAEIIDGRTFIPVRAISEAVNAEVVWEDETKTVKITKPHGDHDIASKRIEKTVTAEDGTVLMNISVLYPAIANTDKDPYINKLNSEFKNYAENYVSETERSFKGDAAELTANMGADFRPMYFALTYTINTDKNDLFSITFMDYANTNGAHPNTARISKSFNIATQKELVLTDILKGNVDDIKAMVYDKFVKYFENLEDADFDKTADALLQSEVGNVSYYITDNSLVLYFQVYQVAPYALSYPTVEIPYDNNTFLIDLSK